MLTLQIKLNYQLADLVAPRWLPEKTSAEGWACISRQLISPTTVKDLLEAVGIPHCEIGRVYGPEGVLGLDHLLNYETSLNVVAIDPYSLSQPRFICDQHLGALARLLRMMGFNTTWQNHWLEAEVARRALNEDRVVLSRNRGLLKRKALTRAMLIRSDQGDAQAREVLRRFQLTQKIEMFGRCTACNGQMDSVAKADVWDLIPPRTRAWLDEYWQCQDCGQLYWEGTHVLAIRKRIEKLP